MINAIYRVTLDIHTTNSQTMLPIKVNDSGRAIVFNLMESGKPYAIADGCTATFRARKSDGTVLYNACTILNNQIIYQLTNQTSASEGIVECELTLYGSNSKQITSPRFALMVDNVLASDSEIESADEFTELAQAITESNNLNIEITTVDDVTTVTVTHKDGTTSSAIVSSGGAVASVNGKTGTVVLTATDVGALSDDTPIPQKTSDLVNDSGFATETYVGNAVSGKADVSDIPTALSDLSSDSTHRLVTDTEKTAWNNKQNALVSGTNIKTINGESVLGSGNIVISGGGGAVDSVNGKTGVVVLTASDVGALPSTTQIPSKTSDLQNDSGFITSSAIGGKEDASNKVTSISSASTDTQYPSAKCVYDLVGDIESLLGALL